MSDTVTGSEQIVQLFEILIEILARIQRVQSQMIDRIAIGRLQRIGSFTATFRPVEEILLRKHPVERGTFLQTLQPMVELESDWFFADW